ncbi:type II toxin-antitoxin system PemK/MazF family toxin [Leucobacter insecticola]|uniref:mRNA interferase n=1 Tax=Leucobacter insecticola TaxID=2714934 RepID=A0A6G8FKH7_9MICO|nr:type II toxin-antitoxin system PemK/MazF family toxin [Leucobacter insecticola]QIM16980.1 type II toxin-antitoxin system PemK/MazF family toxin [Leucobacter insecticola]
MVINHGDVVWVDFGLPRGSEPAKLRPAVVMQGDWLLATQINTVLVVPLTSNLALDVFPGNTLLPKEATSLDKDSVAVVSQLGPVSREFITPYPVGTLPTYLMSEVIAGIKLTLGI